MLVPTLRPVRVSERRDRTNHVDAAPGDHAPQALGILDLGGHGQFAERTRCGPAQRRQFAPNAHEREPVQSRAHEALVRMVRRHLDGIAAEAGTRRNQRLRRGITACSSPSSARRAAAVGSTPFARSQSVWGVRQILGE